MLNKQKNIHYYQIANDKLYITNAAPWNTQTVELYICWRY